MNDLLYLKNLEEAEKAYDEIFNFLLLKKPEEIGRIFDNSNILHLYNFHELTSNFQNLDLIFETGLGGAKFSLKENGNYAITIYIAYTKHESTFLFDLYQNVNKWLSFARGSFIHEYVHFLDYANKALPINFKQLNPKEYDSYFNHESEVKAFILQGIANLKFLIEYQFNRNRRLFEKMFGKTFDSFFAALMKNREIFNYEFIKYANQETRQALKDILQKVYANITQPGFLKEFYVPDMLSILYDLDSRTKEG